MEKRCESVAGCGYAVNGERYSTSLRSMRQAMTSDWVTSMPLMPAKMLMEFGQNIAKAAMYA